jgi:hypothetical protein
LGSCNVVPGTDQFGRRHCGGGLVKNDTVNREFLTGCPVRSGIRDVEADTPEISGYCVGEGLTGDPSGVISQDGPGGIGCRVVIVLKRYLRIELNDSRA